MGALANFMLGCMGCWRRSSDSGIEKRKGQLQSRVANLSAILVMKEVHQLGKRIQTCGPQVKGKVSEAGRLQHQNHAQGGGVNSNLRMKN